jgi:hypothetical protein
VKILGKPEKFSPSYSIKLINGIIETEIILVPLQYICPSEKPLQNQLKGIGIRLWDWQKAM